MPQAALVAGTAVYGAYAQQKAASEQRKISNGNAKLVDEQAEDALVRGQAEVNAVHRRTRQLIGRQKAQAASQGLDVTQGAPVDLVNDSLAMGSMDEATARENAFREAWGLKRQASNIRMGGKFAYRAGRNAAIGTALGGLGESARTYQQYDVPLIYGGK
jgi:hypothetical protein